MYFYIFDPGRERELKHFERIQGRLLNLLSEAHIEGETYRVTTIRTVELLVEQAIGLEAKTLIVVGSDGSLNRVVNALVNKQVDLTLGFIPPDEFSVLGKIFGMSTEIEQAVKTLASRLVCSLDLGKVGEHYFLSKVDLGPTPLTQIDAGAWGMGAMRTLLRLQPFSVSLTFDDSYSATTEALSVQVINCRNNEGCTQKLGNPTDRLLDILILNKLSSSKIFQYRRELASGCLDNVPGATVMHAKKLDIIGPKQLPLNIEGQIYTKAPATIKVAKERIKLIVGKSRQF